MVISSEDDWVERAKSKTCSLKANERELSSSRVMIILNCEMVREELFNENVELLNPHFQSNIIVNLEASNESEEFGTSRKNSKF